MRILQGVALAGVVAAAQGVWAQALFEEASPAALAGDAGFSRGVAWGDFDGDGLADLLVANSEGQRARLYRNLGDGAFEEIDAPALTATRGDWETAVWVDLDGDGDLDAALMNKGGVNLAARNTGSGFEAMDGGALTDDDLPTTVALWWDADADGDVDAYAVHRDGVDDALYLNDGSGRFTRAASGPWVGAGGNGRSGALGDIDGDGLLDIVVAQAREANRVWRATGGGAFEEATPASWLEEERYSYGASFADIDNDGDEDLFLATAFGANELHRNDDGALRPVAGAMTSTDGHAKGHAWGDFDLDGDLDLYLAHGTVAPGTNGFANHLWLNDGRGSFREAADEPFAGSPDVSAGAAAADMDGDGDLDLAHTNWATPIEDTRLWRGTAADRGGRWLRVRLEGDGANTRGLGALVRALVEIDGRRVWLSRRVLAHTGYGSQSEATVHFGLGDAARVERVEARWPGGGVTTLDEVAPNQTVTMRERETGQ